MLKILLFVGLLQAALFAQDDVVCKKCHATIYHEFYDSMHRKSSPKEDKVHQATWDLHPLKSKDDYTCAQCHTPNTQESNKVGDPISCTACHAIASIEEHPTANQNIYTDKPKTFFSATTNAERQIVKFQQSKDWLGLSKSTEGSPYHTIDYTNDLYSSGKVCMGCHSHRQNGHGFELCRTPMEGAKEGTKNCITCHMPKIKGSATSITQTPTHAYHGFAGVYNDPKLLAQYVDIKLERTQNGFDLFIINHAPHDLMLHPLRVVELQATLLTQNGSKKLPSYSFVRIIGKDGKPAMPWLATEVVKDTMIKANETRKVAFDEAVQSGDTVEVKLGFYPVDPKAAKNLNLESERSLTKFTVLKKTEFTIR